MLEMKKKAILIIHGIGEQKEFETLNEFTDGFFQAIRRKMQSAISQDIIDKGNSEFKFDSPGKVKTIVLKYLNFAHKNLKENHINLYEGYWARLSTPPRFRQIITWFILTLFSNLKLAKFFTSIFIFLLGIPLLVLLLIIYIVPFLPLFPLIEFNEIFRMLFLIIIFSLCIVLRNKIYVTIKNYLMKEKYLKKNQSHPWWLNLIGGYVGDIGDYIITFVISYFVLFCFFLQLGQFGKVSLVVFGCLIISNVLMFIVQKIRRFIVQKIRRFIVQKIRRKWRLKLKPLDVIFDILVYFPFLLPFLLLCGEIFVHYKIIISIVFIIVVIVRKFASSFIQNYVGDVVVYTDEEFRDIKEDIKKKIKQKIEVITSEDIDDIYVIGHSLGSVIGYDVLYDVLVKNPIPNKGKIKAYFSIGSPLDKIAYLFRKKNPGLDNINWYNFHEWLDPVGANLNLYEHPKEKLENICSSKYWYNPLSAHTGYWQVPKVMDKMIDIMKIF